jgi:diaminopimelate decarboxylase
MAENWSEYFLYKNGELFCENVPLRKIAEEVGTPFYVYSKNAILDKINQYKEAFKEVDTLICYATKANSNLSILKLIKEEGLGADIVSGGELYKTRKVGIPANKIVYAGVGKTDFELDFALREEILAFNVESKEELVVLNEIAEKRKKKAKIAIRVNPDVDPKTHPYISTGLKKSKFGIDIDEALDAYKFAKSLKNIQIVGIHCHIGSQIMDVSPYKEAIEKVITLIDTLKKEDINISHIDVGGGLGIRYKPEDNPPKPSELADIIIPMIKSSNLKLILEPGRSLMGEAGALVSRVIFTKNKKEKHFIIVDTGMNDLMRPSIYNAYHHILAVKPKKEKVIADIVGPICETGDFLALDRQIDDLKRGELIAIMSAGAYGASMSSNYNIRPRATEVLVDNDTFKVIREREDYKYLTQLEEKALQGEV